MEGRGHARADGKDDERHICCSMTSVLLRLVRSECGEDAVRQHRGSAVATLLRSLGSPEAVLQSITVTANKFGTVSELEAIEAEPGRAVVKAVVRQGFSRHR